MPRTKDLVLFVVVIVFLLIAITFTIFNDGKEESAFTEVQFSTDGQVVAGANYQAKEMDRKSIIERLREAIANEDDVMIAADTDESILGEADLLDEDSTDETEEGVPVCEKSGNAIAFASTWPRDGVELVAAEGVRLVAHITQTEATPVSSDETENSTSSTKTSEPVATKEQRNLATLPLSPVITGEPTCVTSEIVGVTVDGGLLFNSDAIAYRTKTSAELIGYARDGFPIYGNYAGKVDVCGGAEVAGEYRYFIDSADNQVLSCYQGQPQSFVGE